MGKRKAFLFLEGLSSGVTEVLLQSGQVTPLDAAMAVVDASSVLFGYVMARKSTEDAIKTRAKVLETELTSYREQRLAAERAKLEKDFIYQTTRLEQQKMVASVQRENARDLLRMLEMVDELIEQVQGTLEAEPDVPENQKTIGELIELKRRSMHSTTQLLNLMQTGEV